MLTLGQPGIRGAGSRTIGKPKYCAEVTRSHRRLHADDVVHQSLRDRLLYCRDSELALGVLCVKDHRTATDAYNFRGIQSALSASCPLQTGSLALGQAWANR